MLFQGFVDGALVCTDAAFPFAFRGVTAGVSEQTGSTGSNIPCCISLSNLASIFSRSAKGTLLALTQTSQGEVQKARADPCASTNTEAKSGICYQVRKVAD